MIEEEKPLKGSDKTKSEIVDSAAEYGGAIAGSVVGSAMGLAVAGPAGAIGGAAAGALIEKAFAQMGKEIKKRLLSPSEERRTGNVLSLASELIEEKMSQGEQLRDDGFFQDEGRDRSSAEEVLEGTLLAAQREFEERKVVYLARMYANIAFSPIISKQIADYLIKIVERLSYRQLVILHVIGGNQLVRHTFGGKGIFQTEAYLTVSGIENVTIATEVFDLYRMSLLSSSSVIFDSAGINPSALSISGYGAHLYNMMELSHLEPAPDLEKMIEDIYRYLAGKA